MTGLVHHAPGRAASGIAGDAFAEDVAARAATCLLLELETWPKPGLVSHVDRGSHADMDAATFRASIAAIQPFLAELCLAGQRGAGMQPLRVVGLAAEAAMFDATGGINTHRGAIFGLGLMCAAAGARAARISAPAMPLGRTVADLWGTEILRGPVLLHSHGSAMRRRYAAGGARSEASSGFPNVYLIGLPALHAARRKAPMDTEGHRVETCFALIAAIDDTNLLHRGGQSGLRFAQSAARRFLDAGGVGAAGWQPHALSVHQAFIDRNLSPGGAADLLAMTLFADNLERQLP
jgi:triphosphoribosyl-dephospho-CoA synthase